MIQWNIPASICWVVGERRFYNHPEANAYRQKVKKETGKNLGLKAPNLPDGWTLCVAGDYAGWPIPRELITLEGSAPMGLAPTLPTEGTPTAEISAPPQPMTADAVAELQRRLAERMGGPPPAVFVSPVAQAAPVEAAPSAPSVSARSDLDQALALRLREVEAIEARAAAAQRQADAAERQAQAIEAGVSVFIAWKEESAELIAAFRPFLDRVMKEEEERRNKADEAYFELINRKEGAEEGQAVAEPAQ